MRDNGWDEGKGSYPLTEELQSKASDGGRPELDRLFDALSDRRRRFVLYYLRDEEPADLETLARQVAAWERETSTEAIPDDEYESVKTDLYHTQLPKLAGVGIAEYDQRTGVVRYRDPPTEFEKMLQLCARLEEPS